MIELGEKVEARYLIGIEEIPKWVCLRQLSAGQRQRKCSVVSASSLHAGQSGEEIIPVRCWK